MSHKAQALVQTCIDFRFRKALNHFLENELNLHHVDVKSDGGGIKKIVEDGPIREWLFTNYQIAVDLHGVDRVILVNHQDCGAYGGSKAFTGYDHEMSHHDDHLRQASTIIIDKFPGMKVEAYIALISPEQEVSFRKVV